MAEVINTSVRSGNIQYKRMVLTAADGEQVNIRALVKEVHIYEDLFSNNLHGHLELDDSQGLVSTLPIVGQETFTFEYQATGDKSLVLQFVVYKVERERNIGSLNTDKVKLSFISLEAYIGLSTIISRAYKGNNSSIVSDVFNEYLGSDRPLIVEATKGENHVVVPKWTPFFFINWLSMRSVPSNGSLPSYYFFETLKGYNFVSLESLFKNDSVFAWKKQAPNSSGSPNSWTNNKVEYNLATIHEYKLLESNDILYNQLAGMFTSEMYVVDYYSNGFKKVTFDYLNEFKKTSHLNPHPLITARTAAFGHKIETPSVSRVVYDNTKAYNVDVNKYGDWVLKRMSFMEQMNGQRLQLTVPGNGMVKVGDNVTLEFPLKQGSSTLYSTDPIMSGKYIITAIHHTFELTKHSMIVECCKESTIPISKSK